MEFVRLPEAEQVERLMRLARGALGAWKLTDARVEPIKYRENAVFAVTAADGSRSVLRVHRPGYRTDDEIRSEVAWTRALAEAGVPTPSSLPTPDGELVVSAAAAGVPEPRQCDLLAFVEGEPLGSLEAGVDLEEAALRRRYRTVGEIAARIHAHGASWERPAGFERPAWDLDSLVGESPTFGRFSELPSLTGAQLAVLLRARDAVRERLAALAPPRALIHGDLIPDNLLVVPPDDVRVIDFDDCGWSWLGFELATSLFPLLLTGSLEAGREGFLEGYRALRPFPEEELAALPTLTMARGLSYLGWPVGRPEIESQQRLVPYIAAGITSLAELYLTGLR